MNRKHSVIQIRLYLIGATILIVGLLAAAMVYLTASDDDSNVLGYRIINGHEYAIEPGDSKRFQYDMERIAGKSVVVADELNRWFSGLWHGRRLAYTLAFLSLGVAIAFFLVARHPDYRLPDDRKSGKDE